MKIYSFLLLPLLLFWTNPVQKQQVVVPTEPTPAPVFCNPATAEIESLPLFTQTELFKKTIAAERRTRKNIWAMKENSPEIIALKKGIEVMRSRPMTDPTSWAYQAAIHGTNATPALPNWNACAHSSLFFLSWHRMYLYFFERILREASGDPTFALPYWDWSKSKERSLPAVCRQPQLKNPLFDFARLKAVNGGSPIPLANKEVERVLNSPALLDEDDDDGKGFQISLENLHGTIHVLVGSKNGKMGSIKTAADDPIFWLHHCNIDHLWEQWTHRIGKRFPTQIDLWASKKFSFFDEKGNRVTMTGREIVDIAAQLGHVYDDVPPVSEWPAPPPPSREMYRPRFGVTVASASKMEVAGERSRFPLKLTGKKSSEPDPRFFLRLEGIEFQNLPEGTVEVYLNLPKRKKASPESKFFVGHLNTFGLLEAESNEDSRAASRLKNQRFDVSDIVFSSGVLPSEFEVLFVFRPFEGGAAAPRFLVKTARLSQR